MNDRGDAQADCPVLFAGDIHLGRRPAVPGSVLPEAGIEAHELSAAAAWRTTVSYAIERRVRAVVLAGDVVESDNDRFEAFGHLEAGATTLIEAGIPLFAVAGNHDAAALPLLAERISGVTLLGAGGRWEYVPLPGPGAEIDLLGWSFPERIVRNDPTLDPGLEAAIRSRRSSAHLIGVVHGDLDAPASIYAPLDRSRLEATPADAWLLGHIHRPDALRGPRPAGYLGSLAALDAGEPGIHGPWELTAGPDGITIRQVPLSPVRFENLDVPLGEAATADSVMDTIRETVEAALGETIAQAAPWLKLVVLRIALTGQLPDRRAIGELIARHEPSSFFHVRGVPCIVTKIEDRTRPAIDLDALSGETSPAGEVARLIRTLESGAVPKELDAPSLEIIRSWSTGAWDLGPGYDLPDLGDLLLHAAWRALGTLLDHRTTGETR